MLILCAGRHDNASQYAQSNWQAFAQEYFGAGDGGDTSLFNIKTVDTNFAPPGEGKEVRPEYIPLRSMGAFFFFQTVPLACVFHCRLKDTAFRLCFPLPLFFQTVPLACVFPLPSVSNVGSQECDSMFGRVGLFQRRYLEADNKIDDGGVKFFEEFAKSEKNMHCYWLPEDFRTDASLCGEALPDRCEPHMWPMFTAAHHIQVCEALPTGENNDQCPAGCVYAKAEYVAADDDPVGCRADEAGMPRFPYRAFDDKFVIPQVSSIYQVLTPLRGATLSRAPATLDEPLRSAMLNATQCQQTRDTPRCSDTALL